LPAQNALLRSRLRANKFLAIKKRLGQW